MTALRLHLTLNNGADSEKYLHEGELSHLYSFYTGYYLKARWHSYRWHVTVYAYDRVSKEYREIDTVSDTSPRDLSAAIDHVIRVDIRQRERAV